ncbi:MAG: HEPN domain-containing protein [Deltaproteobacteria bacterium]
MRHKKESSSLKDWTEKAERDLKRVRARIKEGDIEDAAFHLQQAVEKYLKAFLLSKGWRLKKIHDLEALLDEAVKYAPQLERFRQLCEMVTGYYLLQRYPFFAEEPAKKEIEKCLKEAQALVEALVENID